MYEIVTLKRNLTEMFDIYVNWLNIKLLFSVSLAFVNVGFLRSGSGLMIE